MSPSRRYIPTLDGWRAIAILLVLFYHDALHRIGPFSTSWLYEHGAIGVDVFFAISGILICTLLLDEEQQTGTIDLQQFYLRRAFRILPPALTYLMILGLLRMSGVITALHGLDWLGSLFFFRNFLSYGPETWYTNHFWSLSVEEHFYLLLPGFLVLCTRYRTRALSLVGIATLVAGMVVNKLHLLQSPITFTDFRLGALFLSAAAAVALNRNRIRQMATRVLQPFPTIVMAAAAVTFLHTFSFVILPFWMVAAVASTMLNPRHGISVLLESKPLRFIGKRSYSLYLWQQLFMTAHYRPGIIDLAMQKWPLSVLCSFVCACLSYSLVEQPLLRIGRRVLDRRTPPQGQVLNEAVPETGG